jgi:hypothetical protein
VASRGRPQARPLPWVRHGLSAASPRAVRRRATPAADTDPMHNRQPGKWIVAAGGLLTALAAPKANACVNVRGGTVLLGWNLFQD